MTKSLSRRIKRLEPNSLRLKTKKMRLKEIRTLNNWSVVRVRLFLFCPLIITVFLRSKHISTTTGRLGFS